MARPSKDVVALAISALAAAVAIACAFTHPRAFTATHPVPDAGRPVAVAGAKPLDTD